jgi:hypothetical protein
MTGPGVPYTAVYFQSPGWAFTTLSYIAFCIISGFSMLFLIQSMQSIPGNTHFQGHIEYSTLINFYFGPTAHVFGQIILYGALQSNAIQSIILITQTIDTVLIDIFGRNCGIALFSMDWVCVTTYAHDSASPFGSTMMLFSFGYLCTLALSLPLGFVKLDANISVIIGFFIINNSVHVSFSWNGNKLDIFSSSQGNTI